jgi:hypothetical protein
MVSNKRGGMVGELYVVGKTKRMKEDTKNTGVLFSKYGIGKANINKAILVTHYSRHSSFPHPSLRKKLCLVADVT